MPDIRIIILRCFNDFEFLIDVSKYQNEESGIISSFGVGVNPIIGYYVLCIKKCCRLSKLDSKLFNISRQQHFYCSKLKKFVKFYSPLSKSPFNFPNNSRAKSFPPKPNDKPPAIAIIATIPVKKVLII